MIHEVLKPGWDIEIEYLLPLLKYHENIYEESLGELRIRSKEDAIKTWNSLPSAGVKRLELEILPDEELPDIQITPEYLSYLDQVVECANKYGKEVLFITTPYVTEPEEQRIHKDMDAYMDEKGYHYLDMTIIPDEIGIDFSTDYYNGPHTNIAGAEKVTTYLAKYLNEHYEFDTSLNEKASAFWDEYLRRWESKKQKTFAKLEKNLASKKKKKQS